MSDIVEKTLASLPRFLSEGLLGGKSPQSPKSTSSRAFQNFMRLVNGVKSKHEEEQIVRREISILQQKLSQPDITPQQMRDYLCRLIYCDMIGYDVSFSYIHAVKFAQQGAALEKRIGYLACSLLLDENHELILLLVNTIQKDLKSSNLLDNCMALTAICQLLNTEMIPMLLPLVEEKLNHPRELVRMKAVMCLHTFLLKAPNLMHHMEEKYRKALCDRDPGVMHVSVHLYYLLIKEDPEKYESIGESLLHIFNQIINRHLPTTFEYHSIPLPWLQIKLLRCLALLGSKSQRITDLVSPMLKDVLERANIKDNMAFAIIYESILTITTIKPNKELLEQASNYVGRFLRSTSRHLQYIGIKALTALVKCGSEFVLDYQIMVVECLDSTDKSIQRKTLELLSCMANPNNVEVVCAKLLEHLSKSMDQYWKKVLVTNVADLADKFSVSREWYVETMFNLLLKSRGCSPIGIVDKIVKVIGSDHLTDENTEDFYKYITARCLEALQQTDLPSDLLHVIIWVFAEYAEFLKSEDEDRVISPLLTYFEKTDLTEETRVCILSSIRKLFCAGVLQKDVLLAHTSRMENHVLSPYTKQRLKELIHFVVSGVRLNSLARKEKTLQLDYTLSFLDDYVSEALETGAVPYKSRQLRYSEQVNLTKTEEKNILSGIEFQAYSQVSDQSATSAYWLLGKPGSSGSDKRDKGLDMTGVKRVWSRQGVVSKDISSQIQSSSVSEKVSKADDPDATEQDGEYEEEKKRNNLASALFRGIVDSQKQVPEMTKKMENGKHSESPSPQQTDSSAKVLPRADIGGWRKLNEKSSNQNNRQHLSTNENSALQQDLSVGDSLTNENCQQFTENRIVVKSSPEIFAIRKIIADRNDSDSEIVLPDGGNIQQTLSTGADREMHSHTESDERVLPSDLDHETAEKSLYEDYQFCNPSDSEISVDPDSHNTKPGTSLYDEFFVDTGDL